VLPTKARCKALDELGCADPIVAAGIKAPGGKLWDGYRFNSLPDFTALKQHTKFPFILFVPQTITESALGERVKEIGIKVHRPAKVVNLVPGELDPTVTDVVFEDGQIVQARYVIGADGTKSVVSTCGCC
jgi:2-polyprenyl-6-methoxyphenol hydroxylase-like FAD-dependent oxidoreductase